MEINLIHQSSSDSQKHALSSANKADFEILQLPLQFALRMGEITYGVND